AIPMPFFGTTPFAALGLGIIASLFMLSFGMWWLLRAQAGARDAGEGHGGSDGPSPHVSDEYIRERATVAREFDPAEVHRGQHSETGPPILLAVLPLAVVVSINLVMSLVILPRLDLSFLAQERWGGTSLSAVGRVRSG